MANKGVIIMEKMDIFANTAIPQRDYSYMPTVGSEDINQRSARELTDIERILDASNDTANYKDVNSICFNKRLHGLSTMVHIAHENELNVSVVIDIFVKLGLDSTSLVLECALGCKRGNLEKAKVEKFLVNIKTESPYILAKQILTEHGVFYKAASRDKDGQFRVTELRWSYAEMPVLQSAYSLSKNKTSKEVKGLEKAYKPGLFLRYLACTDLQLNSKSRDRQSTSFNGFILKLGDELGASGLPDNLHLDNLLFVDYKLQCGWGGEFSFNNYDTLIGKYNERIITSLYKWYLSDNIKFLANLSKLKEERDKCVEQLLAYQAKKVKEEKDKYNNLRYGNPLEDLMNSMKMG